MNPVERGFRGGGGGQGGVLVEGGKGELKSDLIVERRPLVKKRILRNNPGKECV